jgi:hypothetical protein
LQRPQSYGELKPVDDLETLIQQLERRGKDVFWQGKASPSAIDQLGDLLGATLPDSFREFLRVCGGGGVVGEEISGIEDDDPSLQHRGTVYGDTLSCRETYDLPDHLSVVYLNVDVDAVWCLDAESMTDGECRIVSYDVYSKVTRPLAASFRDFLKEYVSLRTSSQ